MLAFLPIAAGYHAAHYLTALLGNGQYLIAALNDPLARGASLLGLPHHWVSFGFATDPAAVTAHLERPVRPDPRRPPARRADRPPRSPAPARAIAHLPMTALMVAYTVLGLWLLAAPTAA